MARVIRTRRAQPDTSPGVVVAAILLVVLISMDWLVWWTLLLDVVVVVPLVNGLLTGRTTKEEIVIQKDL